MRPFFSYITEIVASLYFQAKILLANSQILEFFFFVFFQLIGGGAIEILGL